MDDMAILGGLPRTYPSATARQPRDGRALGLQWRPVPAQEDTMPATDEEAQEIRALRRDVDALKRRASERTEPGTPTDPSGGSEGRLEELERAVFGADWAREREARATAAAEPRLRRLVDGPPDAGDAPPQERA